MLSDLVRAETAETRKEGVRAEPQDAEMSSSGEAARIFRISEEARLRHAGTSLRLCDLCANHSAFSALASSRETNLTAPFPRTSSPTSTSQLPTLEHIAASYLYTGDDVARIAALDALASANGLSILATNDVLYHAPHRRPLHDVMTAIRHKTTVARAGQLLQPNAERHLKGPAEMARLFARWPHALAAAREVADACRFSLDELRYEYPRRDLPRRARPADLP